MNLQIGVKVIIRNSDGQLLFIKRTELLENESTTSWDIPGGRINAEENLSDALHREVREELGIELVGVPKLMTAQDIFVVSKDLHVVRLTYIHDQDIATIALSDEHDAYEWKSFEEVGSLNTEPYLKETLEILLS